MRFSLSPQRGEGRGEGWECRSGNGKLEIAWHDHLSPSIPPHEPEGRSTLSSARRSGPTTVSLFQCVARRDEDIVALPFPVGSAVPCGKSVSAQSLPVEG